MSPEVAFSISNVAVLPAWLLLAFAPSWSHTQRIVHSIWIPLLLGGVYILAFVASPTAPEGADFTSLQGVMQLFTSPFAVLAGWVHYLTFDLFVGAWQVRDAGRRGVPHLAVLPCLLLTLMLGPAGLLCYLLLRFALTRALSLDEHS